MPQTSTDTHARRSNEKGGQLGHPSYVWRAGQQRRFAMIQHWARIEHARVLVDGAGVGMYSRHLEAAGATVISLDIDYPSMVEAHRHTQHCVVGVGEHLPFLANTFDTILSHEVLEHVQDDAAAVTEMARVLKPGGRAVIFVPNRLYFFETHGHYWKGDYHFGNTPLINYLPDRWRNQLAPHVRAYRTKDLQRLFAPLPLRVIHWTQIYPGYDNIIARQAALGKSVRGITRWLEKTPLRALGISHFIVLEKQG